jgi:anti-sigma B factor antagonist
MTLTITSGEANGVTVLWLEGRIVLGEESSALRQTVKSLLADGKKNIVINLSNVTFIDSSGLGALVTAYSSVKSGGGALRLCRLGTRFSELLQITRLYTVFDVSDNEEEAVRAMAKRIPAD